MRDIKRCLLFFSGLVLSIACLVMLDAKSQTDPESKASELVADPVVSSAADYKNQEASDFNHDASDLNADKSL